MDELFFEDYGLGAIVFQLMLGEADPKFFPGINMLIKNEAGPTGVFYREDRRWDAIVDRLKKELPQSDLAKVVDSALLDLHSALEAFTIRAFQYGGMLAPLIRSAAENQKFAQSAWDWNRFWSYDSRMSLDYRSVLTRRVLEDVQKLEEDADFAARCLQRRPRPEQADQEEDQEEAVPRDEVPAFVASLLRQNASSQPPQKDREPGA